MGLSGTMAVTMTPEHHWYWMPPPSGYTPRTSRNDATQAQAVLDASRPSGHLTVALDGDDAGRAAAARAFPLLNAPDVEISVELEPGADPASLLQRDGRDGLHDALFRTRPLADVVVDQKFERHPDRLEWPEGRLAATRAAVPTIALVPAEQALRQVKRVATESGSPSPPSPTNWQPTSPATCLRAGRQRRSPSTSGPERPRGRVDGRR